MSFYAVEKHGIVRSWDECQKLTSRTPLKFKKFKSEHDAQAFLDDLDPQKINPTSASKQSLPQLTNVADTLSPTCPTCGQCIRSPTPDVILSVQAPEGVKKNKELDFYTDGSHIKGTPQMGFGIFCETDGSKYGMHQSVTEHWAQIFFNDSTTDFRKLSNPSMELLAVCYLFREIVRVGYKIEGVKKITIHHDYTGVSEWILGRWRAKEPHIKVFVDDVCGNYKKLCEMYDVSFFWVKGHSGVYGNECADKLAGGEKITRLLPLNDLFFSWRQGL